MHVHLEGKHMTLEQTAELPIAEHFPVHIQLSIFPDGSEYMAFLNVDMNIYRIPIPLTRHDVQAMHMELQKAIERVAFNLELGEEGNTSAALTNLAEAGNFVFNRIFPKGPRRETMRQALKTGTTIQVSAEHFALPWELLYDGSLEKDFDISCFWGMDHIVSRAIIQEARPGDLLPSCIQTSRPLVGLVAYDHLKYVIQQEIPALQKLHRNHKIKLSRLRALDHNKRDQELHNFGRFLNQNHHLVHLACHAQEEQPVHQSYLRIANEFKISIKDFVIHEFEIKGNPFVVLNACLTSIIDPLYTSYWAAEFLKRGARGVLATELHIPDNFAAAFTEELYSHLLIEGRTIGDALQATRHYFWQRHRNPLGLAYALYASPSFRIVKAN
jgi:hypothetical protein